MARVDLEDRLMTPFDLDDFAGEISQTERAAEHMRLHGPTFSDDEPDMRPLPDDIQMQGTVADMFYALDFCLSDSPLEEDREGLLWGLVNLFHRAAERLDRQLDDNTVAQQSAQLQQDGSEVKAVELERLIERGRALTSRQEAIEALRELAAEHFQRATLNAWRPKAGSLVSRRHLTSAMIESRDYIAARETSRLKVLAPKGTQVAFSGGLDFQDVDKIWILLDKVLTKHPDMVLLNTASPTGADLIASKWAAARNVTEVSFKPNWKQFKTAAPFKRNEALLGVMPAGFVIFPGSGIQDNLADGARAMGIPVWRGGS